MSIQDKQTKVYRRCESCGRIAGGSMPEGWIDLGPAPGTDGTRMVCSAECRRKFEAERPGT